MLILNTGLPRSGTVLTNHVARMIMDMAQRQVISFNTDFETAPQYIARYLNNGQLRWKNIMLHMHDWHRDWSLDLRPHRGHIVPIMNIRDPRDIAVSLRKLHSCSLAHAVKLVGAYSEQLGLYMRDFDPIMIRYETMMAHKPALIEQIAFALDVTLGPAHIKTIMKQTSVETAQSKVAEIATVDADKVHLIPNTHRVMREDRETHLTDRQIQSGQSGRWRNETTEQEQEFLRKTLTPLVNRFGYTA
jgi:hypothetical protein